MRLDLRFDTYHDHDRIRSLSSGAKNVGKRVGSASKDTLLCGKDLAKSTGSQARKMASGTAGLVKAVARNAGQLGSDAAKATGNASVKSGEATQKAVVKLLEGHCED